MHDDGRGSHWTSMSTCGSPGTGDIDQEFARTAILRKPMIGRSTGTSRN